MWLLLSPLRYHFHQALLLIRQESRVNPALGPQGSIMSEVVCIKSQEEYEDDFEKDLDWLIGEDQVRQLDLRLSSPGFPFSGSSLFRSVKGARG